MFRVRHLKPRPLSQGGVCGIPEEYLHSHSDGGLQTYSAEPQEAVSRVASW